MIFKTKKINTDIFKEKRNPFINKINEYLNSLETEYEKETAKNLIEKMAVWYELRYPYYTIEGIFNPENDYKEITNNAMFKNNQYVNTLLGDNSDIKDLDWDEFYNTHAFINSLNPAEKIFFKIRHNKYETYMLFVNFPGSGFGSELWVNRAGYIYHGGDISDDFYYHTNMNIKVDNINGMHIKDIFKFIDEFNNTNKAVSMSLNDWDEKAIKELVYKMERKEGLLDCVMYKILDRRDKGVPYIGAYRAFLFAKEFNRDINIPIKYAFDNHSYLDSETKQFIKEFIECGGSKDINYYCGDDYDKEYPFAKIVDTINEIKEENIVKKQREEEMEQLYSLRERLVYALQTKVDNTATREEKKAISKIEKKKIKKIDNI